VPSLFCLPYRLAHDLGFRRYVGGRWSVYIFTMFIFILHTKLLFHADHSFHTSFPQYYFRNALHSLSCLGFLFKCSAENFSSPVNVKMSVDEICESDSSEIFLKLIFLKNDVESLFFNFILSVNIHKAACTKSKLSVIGDWRGPNGKFSIGHRWPTWHLTC